MKTPTRHRRARRNVILGKPIGRLTAEDYELLTPRERRWVTAELVRREIETRRRVQCR